MDGIFFIIILVVAGLFWYQHHAHKQRLERARQWAKDHGWNYTASDPALTKFSSGQPFGRGHSHRANKVLQGPLGGPGGRHCVSFTYTWTQGHGKNSRTYYRHIVAVHLGLSVPRIDVGPDSGVPRLMGGQRVNFEWEEFNQAWTVSSTDPRFAHGIIHPRVMELLMTPEFRGRTYRYEGHYLMMWFTGRTDLNVILPAAAHLAWLADRIPNYKFVPR